MYTFQKGALILGYNIKAPGSETLSDLVFYMGRKKTENKVFFGLSSVKFGVIE
ncbi:hypothetical protein KSC_080250 [Ktedonobacter sp. SOSP1-52]|nr:hypothetical protein KSC_080250 [Ktedonobacter sp. SOSP1-52]